MDRLFEFVLQHPTLLALVTVGWMFLAGLFVRRLLRGAEPEKDVVFVEDLRKGYPSYEAFRKDLVNDDVSVHDVFTRCAGGVPAKNVPPPSAEPLPPANDKKIYFVRQCQVTQKWDVLLRNEDGLSVVVSSHMSEKDARAMLQLYIRYS